MLLARPMTPMTRSELGLTHECLGEQHSHLSSPESRVALGQAGEAAVGTQGPPLGHSAGDHQTLPSKMPFRERGEYDDHSGEDQPSWAEGREREAPFWGDTRPRMVTSGHEATGKNSGI